LFPSRVGLRKRGKRGQPIAWVVLGVESSRCYGLTPFPGCTPLPASGAPLPVGRTGGSPGGLTMSS
jgi:hypothetical protein